MGLKCESERGAATLGNGSTDADFHCVGTTDEVRDKFRISASGDAKTGAPIHKHHDGMLSSPVAVDVREISSVTSSTHNRQLSQLREDTGKPSIPVREFNLIACMPS